MQEGTTQHVAKSDGRPVVMIVEDDVLIRFPIAEHLRALNFAVIEAANGTEAINVLAAGTPVDVVFSDVQMPGPVDGLGVLAWLLKYNHPAHLIFTSGDGKSTASVAEKTPTSRIFAKPYRMSDIADYIRVLLSD